MKLKRPKSGTQFCWYNGRPALFHVSGSHEAYWRDYWDESARARLLESGAKGELGEFESVVTRHVRQDMPVLEAGCGPGHLVAALRTRGYQAFGIDYEPEVVRFVNETMPELDVRQGNVLSLPLPDGSLGAYLSLGVVEHFPEGPEAALQEARRVLHEKGRALISVPYLNPLRQKQFTNVKQGTQSVDRSFHQYYFDRDTFSGLLGDAGFDVVETYGYAVEAFLTREHPITSRFWTSFFCRERIKRPLRRRFSTAAPWMRDRYGHMMLYVCRSK